MRYQAALIAVKSIAASRAFYEGILGQKVVLDLGANVTFQGGFAIQENYPELLGEAGLSFAWGGNDHELYFEEADFDAFAAKITATDGVELLHPVKEYPWGQRVIRLYDPDRHIVEVGEPMESVFRRFASQGMSEEEIAERAMSPLAFVKQLLR